MRAWKALTAFLFVLTLGVPARATADSIPVGVLVFDTFIAGPDGVNALFVSNFTGDPAAGGFALAPDFPVVTALTFNSPLLEWTGPTGSLFDFGHAGIGPGSHDPDPQIQFPDADLFLNAKFSAILSQPIFQLADGRFFQAVSSNIAAVLANPAGALAPGDLAILSVEAREVTQPTAVPEPASLMLLATAMGLWQVRRRRH